MTDFTHIVVCKSSRNGVRPVRMVLHTTEGANRPGIVDLQGLANYFDRLSTQASSHKGIDAEGNLVTMVPDSWKAWTQSAYNPGSLSIEFVGEADKLTKRAWVVDYHYGLRRAAKQLAEWSIKHNIPLRHGVSLGVCQHKDLGILGGGHHDCGAGFPERYLLVWARLFKLRQTKPKGWKIAALALKLRVLRQQRYYGNRHGTT